MRTPQQSLSKTSPAGAVASRGLEWLWQHLHDVPHPCILECGPVRQSTVDVLVRRGAKLYVTDLLSPALRRDAEFWECSGKVPVFRLERFLSLLPEIRPESLSAVFCWHLLDLLPRDSLLGVIDRLFSYLRPGGMLLCVLREPNLAVGADTVWCLEALTRLGTTGEGKELFHYPALTNREVERLAPGGSVKTFLTRTGRREVLVRRERASELRRPARS